MSLNTEAMAMIMAYNKKFGQGTISIASEIVEPPKFTSGSLRLDHALGGGWPGNQWCEIYGKESHGKTTVVLKTVAANQKADPEFTTLWIASEHYDVDQAEALGVDTSRVIVVPTQDMTFAYETVITFAGSMAVDCVVIDSYPALIPPDEEAKEMQDHATMAEGARATGKFFRKVGPAMKRGKDDRPVLGLFINQQRDNIGGWAPRGVPQTTPGGNGKNYAFYTRVKVSRDEYIEEAAQADAKRSSEKTKVGQIIKVETVKNKAASPGQVARIAFYFRDAPEHGFARGDYDLVAEAVSLSLVFGIVESRGAYVYYGDRKWNGKAKYEEALRGELDLFDEISEAIRNHDGVIFDES